MRSYTAVTLRQLSSRRGRLFLTISGIVLGTGMIVGVLLLTTTIQRTFTDLYDSIYGKADLVLAATSDAGALPEDALARVRTTQGVDSAVGQVTAVLSLVGADGPGAELNAAGTTVEGQSYSDLEIVSGRKVRGGRETELEASWAEANGLQVGDTASLATPSGIRDYRVAGLFKFSTGVDFGGEGFGFLPLGEARRAFGQPAGWSEIQAVVSEEGTGAVDQVKRRLDAEFGPGVEVITPQGKSDQIQSQLQALNVILYFFAGMALFVGGFLIFNSFNMTVLQRMREIGMQRTLGASRGMVVRSVLTESSTLGIAGSLLGILGGIGIALALIALLRSIGLPVGALQWTAAAPVAGILMGLITATAGSLIPALRAGRIAPIRAVLGSEGLRSRPKPIRAVIGICLVVPGLYGAFTLGAADQTTTAVVAAGIGGIIAIFFGIALLAPFVVSPLSRLLSWPVRKLAPIEGRLASDSARANPTRTAATATALLIGLALVVGINSLGSSFLNSIEREFDRAFARDLTVQPRGLNPGAGPQQSLAPSVLGEISDLPGVAVATPERLVATAQLPQVAGRKGNGPQGLLFGFDPSVYDKVDSSQIDTGELTRAEAYARVGKGALTVGKGYAEEAGIEIGDEMLLEGASGAEPAPVVAIVDTILAGGQTVSMSLEKMARVYGITSDTQIAVKADSVDARAEVKREIERLLEADYPNLTVLSNDEIKSEVESQISQQFGFFNALVAVAILASLFGIVNTLSMSVLERTREIGVLRALGATRWQIRRTVANESLIISLIGAVLGISIGVGLGWALLQGLAAGVPGVVYSPPIGTMFAVAVAAVLLGLIAAIVPARRAAKLDVVDALSYE